MPPRGQFRRRGECVQCAWTEEKERVNEGERLGYSGQSIFQNSFRFEPMPKGACPLGKTLPRRRCYRERSSPSFSPPWSFPPVDAARASARAALKGGARPPLTWPTGNPVALPRLRLLSTPLLVLLFRDTPLIRLPTLPSSAPAATTARPARARSMVSACSPPASSRPYLTTTTMPAAAAAVVAVMVALVAPQIRCRFPRPT